MMGTTDDAPLRRRFRRPLAVLLALAATSAWGQVTLDTSVARVQTTLDGGGRARRELVPVEEVVPGEELRYTITFHNDSAMVVDAGRIVITNPIPDGAVYVPGTAGGEDTRVEYSTDGATFTSVEPDEPAAAGALADAGTAGTESGTADPVGTMNGLHSLRWTYQEDLAPGESGEVYFHVRML